MFCAVVYALDDLLTWPIKRWPIARDSRKVYILVLCGLALIWQAACIVYILPEIGPFIPNRLLRAPVIMVLYYIGTLGLRYFFAPRGTYLANGCRMTFEWPQVTSAVDQPSSSLLILPRIVAWVHNLRTVLEQQTIKRTNH